MLPALCSSPTSSDATTGEWKDSGQFIKEATVMSKSTNSADDATDLETNDIDQLLTGRTLIVASNRGPVTFTHEGDGKFSSRKGSGGVVTAVSSIARDQQPVWVACAMTEGDRLRAELAAKNGEVLISP